MLNVEEEDAHCVFAPGDTINAYVHVSGNHGGRTADGDGAWWGYRKFGSDASFQKIPGSETDFDFNGPLGTYGHHVETFVLPSELESGWYTLRWEWHAPAGTLQFVNCVEARVEGSSVNPPATTTQTTSIVTTSTVMTTRSSSTSLTTTSGIDPDQWPVECGEARPCARVAMLAGGEMQISMMGPANVWFGIGFDAVEMRDEPYAIIVNGDGVVSERKLAFHSAGKELDPQVVLLEESTAGGVRKVLLQRSAVGMTGEHRSFDGEPMNYIYAFGLQSNFGFHGLNFGRWASCVPIGDCDPNWCRVNEAFAWCAAQTTNSCHDMWCTRGDPALALPGPARPTPPTTSAFIPADGGSNRACRGRSSSDNSASHYSLIPGAVPTLEACKTECLAVNGCVGIEYNSDSGRCEVWTRPEGIQATAAVPGYQCWQYSSGATQTTTTIPGFDEVDGGSNRACRGRSSSDNSASHYSLIPGAVPTLEACKTECLAVNGCVGIEYNSDSGRCEVWTRPEGIQATAAVPGYQCWHYQAGDSGSLLSVRKHAFRGTVLIQDEARVKHHAAVHEVEQEL